MWMYVIGDPDRRARFLVCNGSLKSFQTVVIKFVRDYQGGHNKACDNGHLSVEELLPFMTESLFNCFSNKFTKDTLSKIHKGKKKQKTGRDTSQEEKRRRETRKRQKLWKNKEQHSILTHRQYMTIQ